MGCKQRYLPGMVIITLLAVCCRPALGDDVTYGYDDHGRLSSIRNSTDAMLSTMLITFDTAGNIAEMDTTINIVDTDGDDMPDAWEATHGLNPNDPADAQFDTDGDGLVNLAEYQIGTDPTNPDTDGDGVGDGVEMTAGTNPLDPASYPVSDVAVPLMSDFAMGLLALLLMGLGMRNLLWGSGRNIFR